VKEIQLLLQQIFGLQAKKSTGAGLTAKELDLMHTLPALQKELQDMVKNQIRSVCVRVTQAPAPFYDTPRNASPGASMSRIKYSVG
jgi:hypothetical protein